VALKWQCDSIHGGASRGYGWRRWVPGLVVSCEYNKTPLFVFLHFAVNAISRASYVVSVKCPQEKHFPGFTSFLACYNENLHHRCNMTDYWMCQRCDDQSEGRVWAKVGWSWALHSSCHLLHWSGEELMSDLSLMQWSFYSSFCLTFEVLEWLSHDRWTVREYWFGHCNYQAWSVSVSYVTSVYHLQLFTIYVSLRSCRTICQS
jgi:hypothetical protein